MTSPVPSPWLRRLVLLTLSPLLVLSVACGPEEKPRPELTVFAAASLTDVLPEIAKAWKAEGGTDVRYSFGATSKLVPQVIEGAPADALVSADVAWIERLEAAGTSDKASRVVLAGNGLVFIVSSDVATPPTSAKELPGSLKKIALAGENVPAGRYAKTALERTGVWSAVEPRVVRGEDVRLTLRWVSSGDAEGGVVYRTDAMADARVKVAFEFPADSHPPIVYPAAPIKGAANAAEAARFLDFCRGPKARPIFDRYGFLPPNR